MLCGRKMSLEPRKNQYRKFVRNFGEVQFFLFARISLVVVTVFATLMMTKEQST